MIRPHLLPRAAETSTAMTTPGSHLPHDAPTKLFNTRLHRRSLRSGQHVQ